MSDLAELTGFAQRYAEAWCSLVTGHWSPVTSLISGYELWKIDKDGLIAESKELFRQRRIRAPTQTWRHMNLDHR